MSMKTNSAIKPVAYEADSEDSEEKTFVISFWWPKRGSRRMFWTEEVI